MCGDGRSIVRDGEGAWSKCQVSIIVLIKVLFIFNKFIWTKEIFAISPVDRLFGM